MSEKRIYETVIGGRTLRVEIGELAKQANAAAMLYYGDSAVLSVAVAKDSASTQDFFPLTVLYQEKLYAAGKIPGGFLRREGRPSEHETLTSRLIDRPIRPLFPDGYRNEVQIINTVMSSDHDATPEMTALIGSSLTLMLSNIPFKMGVAGVIVGRVNGKLIINPTVAEMEQSDIDLTVAGTKEAINMVEAGAKQVTEEDMLAALMFGHAEIKKIVEFQEQIQKELGQEKAAFDMFVVDQAIEKAVKAFAEERLIKAVSVKGKHERQHAIDLIVEETVEKFGQKAFFKEVEGVKVFDAEAKDTYMKSVKMTLENIEIDEVRRLITEDKVRPDGRKVNEIRPLSSRVDLLPRVHGSALFTRGQTQALSITTLGSLGENQIIDGLSPEDSKRFMLHYNFPQFSVGETGRYGSPGRREIGHGALGERAILQVLPNEEEFPYTIRVVSEILESNGSTSQASICAGTMSLMAAGVPLKAPVAGIAMGLIKKGDAYTILSDIQGLEDHFGDMDFKVAGTKDGITALQMDIKIDGLTEDILREALAQAKEGRLEILNHMLSTIPAVREDLSPYAPKVVMMKINPDKIRDVIGAGGKIISQIIEDCNQVKIDIEQDGRVFLMHSDMVWIKKAKAMIENLTRQAEIGKVYEGTVVRIEKFGCFVELWKGTEGLVHISKLAKERVEKVESIVSVGDVILVKCIGIDDKGRIDLSRKDALEQ
ncbi:polyribonucleotide nucleotidyltransferase [Paracholeplasma manati]|uniref:Polyribonucleotide nucleotidyltransferase n=1 Tax=Paracholeplasma manati TaxID=591373 RepID=A0ABT2Y639_9MOLU|nr:polyribonucleotide nucleotidyltransferase [Paracholeplasma manati]MCV2232208.1 polyribonucleotide nucleotidyltransferase [Paracholeplasma manati]MDG0888165.1 polyribonucleotide nucleotidyltransferase [Paracholeplasma manati]